MRVHGGIWALLGWLMVGCGGDSQAASSLDKASQTSASDDSRATVLWANGLLGECAGRGYNAEGSIGPPGDGQALYGPGFSAWLDAGQYDVVVGSGVYGCGDFSTSRESVQAGHVYLVTAWGDPTSLGARTDWVDLTSEITGLGSGYVFVNLSMRAGSVQFKVNGVAAAAVDAPGYAVVPAPSGATVTVSPTAEPGSLTTPELDRPLLWLVLYRDSSDQTHSELFMPVATDAR